MPDQAPRASAGQNEEQLPKMMPKLAARIVRGHTLAQFFAAVPAHSGIFLFHSEPGSERLLLASASIRLAPGPVLYVDGTRAWLYFKSLVTGDEKDYILEYKGIHRFHTSRQPTNFSARKLESICPGVSHGGPFVRRRWRVLLEQRLGRLSIAARRRWSERRSSPELPTGGADHYERKSVLQFDPRSEFCFHFRTRPRGREPQGKQAAATVARRTI